MLRSVLLTAFFATLALAAHAQGWHPEKPVEIILPTAPGGGNDTVARLMQKMLQESKAVSTPVLVVNKSGGNQAVSVDRKSTRLNSSH